MNLLGTSCQAHKILEIIYNNPIRAVPAYQLKVFMCDLGIRYDNQLLISILQ